MKNLRGRVAYIFSAENFDVDQIVGVTNSKVTDVSTLINTAMHDFDPDFVNLVRPGDLIVGGENFGYGHPHYPAMKFMRYLGIPGVIAESFAPGFWRNEINMGFVPVSCRGIVGLVDRWDEIEMDWTGTVINHTKGTSLACDVFAPSDLAIIKSGGLINHLKKDMGILPADS